MSNEGKNPNRGEVENKDRVQRRKTQRANLPPPPPPPCDSNDDPVVPESTETTGAQSASQPSSQRPNPPRKIAAISGAKSSSPHNSPETRTKLNGNVINNIPKGSPELSHTVSDTTTSDNSPVAGVVTNNASRIPKPSPRHSLVLDKAPELSTVKAAPRPAPRVLSVMDKPKASPSRPGNKPVPPPQESKPKYQASQAKLKERFLDVYGNGTSKPANQPSVVSRSVSAINNTSGAQLRPKQWGPNRSEGVNKASAKDKRESMVVGNQSVFSIKSGSIERRASAVTNRESTASSRRAVLSKVPSAAEMRESVHRDKVVIADFLEQLKDELGTDGSDVGSPRSSINSATTDECRSSAPREIEASGAKLKRVGSKESDVPDVKSRRGSKDKIAERKEPKSRSKFYTGDDDKRDSIVSRTSVKSTGSSTFYITEEREEIVQEVKENKTVSSRTVSHQKSTVCATKNLFEKNSTSNITRNFEDLTPKDITTRSDRSSPPKLPSPPKTSVVPPRTIFGISSANSTTSKSQKSDVKSSSAKKTEISDIKTSRADKTQTSAMRSSPQLPKKARDKDASGWSPQSSREVSPVPPLRKNRVTPVGSPNNSREVSPVAPVRKSRLARKQTSPEKMKPDLAQFVKKEFHSSSITKSVSSHVISHKTSASAQQDVCEVVRRSDASKTHRRQKSIMSFTAEDTDIFQRKSTEYLLEDISPGTDMTVSTSSTESAASTPRISRRDFPGLSLLTASDKRRSRSLEPSQSPWGVKLKCTGKPSSPGVRHPMKPPKPSPPLLKQLSKTPPKPPPKTPNLSQPANTTDIYCDASSKPLEDSTITSDVDHSRDSAPNLYDNNFDFATPEKDHTKDNFHKRKSMTLPVIPTRDLSACVINSSEENAYEEFEFQKTVSGSDSAMPQDVETNRTADSPLAELGITPVSMDDSNNESVLDESDDVSKVVDDSTGTLVDTSHRSSTSSDSSFCDPRRAVDHIYADVDDVVPKRTTSSSSDQSEHVYECVDMEETAKKTKRTSALKLAKNLNQRFLEVQNEDSDGSGPKGAPKLSRKLSRKVARNLSRKWTKKYGQSEKYEKLKKLLQEFEDEASQDGEEEEALEFSDSDTESWDDDSFTDESDLEFEQELLSKLNLDDREALGDYSSTPKTLNKTQKIATELLTTERSYVRKLHLIDQVFHNRIMIENREVKMFPNDVVPQMFSNVKSIYLFHHDFLLPPLENRMKEWSSCEKIGDVMCKYAPFLKMYTEYVQNFDTSMHTINTWREKSPRFSALLQELQELPECDKLTLQHHMLCPIQRVPRYELMLKEYLKNLALDSDDREETEKALAMVTTAALTSNNIMRSNEKFKKLVEVNDKLGGVLDLVSPTRELIKEGRIVKLAARNGVHQERYIFLFNDVFILCQSVPVSLKQQYKVSYKLSIDGMQIQDGDNLETPNTFYVKNKQKILELHCDTEEEKMTWQIALWNVISEYLKKKQTRGQAQNLEEEFSFGVEPGKTPPKWIKDQETSQCMLCGSSFTTFRRRHHCRGCGKVVCGKCSSFKAKLEYDGDKLNRVCTRCFGYLEKKGNVEISGPILVSSPALRHRRVLQVKASEGGVHSGYMHMSLDKKTWNRRWFAVRKDYVLYSFKAHQDVVALTSMPLPGYMVQKADSTDSILDREHVLKLWHMGQRKVYYFHVDNKDLLEKWQRVLEYVVQAEMPPDFVEKADNGNDRESVA